MTLANQITKNKSPLVLDHVSDIITGVIGSSIVIYPRPESHKSSASHFVLYQHTLFCLCQKKR